MSVEQLTCQNSEIAYAKINLALHVRRRLPNSYHEIETIFAFLNDGDRVSVKEGRDLTLSITGPFAERLDTKKNLVLDAANLLARSHNIESGASIKLNKMLPVASGIGGGSADAAATLRLLNRFWNLGLSIEQLADLSKPLGADVPACVFSRTCRGEGIGQELSPMQNGKWHGYSVLLANPGCDISTARVFELWDGIDRGALIGSELREIALAGRNDLQDHAIDIAPNINEILEQLDSTEPVFSRMSGSGATCFALYQFDEQAAESSAKIKEALPETWTTTGKIR